jgi:hypothetical protein
MSTVDVNGHEPKAAPAVYAASGHAAVFVTA